MPITTIQEKFATAIGEMYDAENRFLSAQQVMLERATDGSVKQMLEEHISETEQQIDNLKQVCELVGLPSAPVPAADAEGLVRQGEQLLAQVASNPAICDCAIADAQAKVEHFEIACYRALVLGAQAMGHRQAAQLLQQNLQQEEAMAQRVEQGAPLLIEKALGLEPGSFSSNAGSAGRNSQMNEAENALEIGFDPGLTDLGDDVYRSAGNQGSRIQHTTSGMEAGIDPRTTDLGDDGERPA